MKKIIPKPNFPRFPTIFSPPVSFQKQRLLRRIFAQRNWLYPSICYHYHPLKFGRNKWLGQGLWNGFRSCLYIENILYFLRCQPVVSKNKTSAGSLVSGLNFRNFRLYPLQNWKYKPSDFGNNILERFLLEYWASIFFQL